VIRDAISSKESGLDFYKEIRMKLSVISKQVLTASLVLAATTGLAFAKNYKGENYKGEAMPEPCPAPAMLMGGFYLGGQVGYDVYRVKESVPVEAASIKANVPGWLAGLVLGYGQYFNTWYLGGEVFGNWDNANDSYNIGTYSSKFEANANYGLSLLPGVKLNDTTLAYLRLGWNWANLKAKENVAGVASSKSETSNGFQWGLGLETLLTGNWSFRGEYNYTSFDSFTNAATATKFNPSDNQVLFGIIYHFA
jgi:opacity protein-like surface antigen